MLPFSLSLPSTSSYTAKKSVMNDTLIYCVFDCFSVGFLVFPLFSCFFFYFVQMAGLQSGRKIYSINEDLVFLRSFSEVETMINQSFCIRRSLRLLVATKNKEWVLVHGRNQILMHRRVKCSQAQCKRTLLVLELHAGELHIAKLLFSKENSLIFKRMPALLVT